MQLYRPILSVPLLESLRHWRLYHPLRMRDNGESLGLAESCFEGHDRRHEAPSVSAKEPLPPRKVWLWRYEQRALFEAYHHYLGADHYSGNPLGFRQD